MSFHEEHGFFFRWAQELAGLELAAKQGSDQADTTVFKSEPDLETESVNTTTTDFNQTVKFEPMGRDSERALATRVRAIIRAAKVRKGSNRFLNLILCIFVLVYLGPRLRPPLPAALSVRVGESQVHLRIEEDIIPQEEEVE